MTKSVRVKVDVECNGRSKDTYLPNIRLIASKSITKNTAGLCGAVDLDPPCPCNPATNPCPVHMNGCKYRELTTDLEKTWKYE